MYLDNLDYNYLYKRVEASEQTIVYLHVHIIVCTFISFCCHCTTPRFNPSNLP